MKNVQATGELKSTRDVPFGEWAPYLELKELVEQFSDESVEEIRRQWIMLTGMHCWSEKDFARLVAHYRPSVDTPS